VTWTSVGLAALSLGVFGLMFIPLERAFPARPGQRILRPELGIDLCFFLGQYLLWSFLAVGFLTLVQGWLQPVVPAGWRAAAGAMPPVVGAIVAVVAGDFLVYWWHRACHRFAFLWRFHAVHHSSHHLDWVAAHREHPLDGLTTQLAQNLPAIALGLHFDAIAFLVVIRGAWGLFIHSNTRLSVGPLRFLMGAPELHHHHHARDVGEKGTQNYANLAPWLDVLFGTYHRPTGPETYPLGLTEPWPRGYLAQLVRPFVPARLAGQRLAAPVVLLLVMPWLLG
jgi:sterol desaturase/sphingolipid hydroxylase (fatty acid hydroxylase superfamily)